MIGNAGTNNDNVSHSNPSISCILKALYVKSLKNYLCQFELGFFYNRRRILDRFHYLPSPLIFFPFLMITQILESLVIIDTIIIIIFYVILLFFFLTAFSLSPSASVPFFSHSLYLSTLLTASSFAQSLDLPLRPCK